MRWLRPLLALALLTAPVAGQQPAAAPAASTATLSVFLDCPNVGCDFDYFRTEITAVNWVRDRAVADIHILVTGEDTGAGGRDFTVTFIGLRRFAALSDTLHQVLPPGFTEDDRRTNLARLFRSGLVRYIARTDGASKLDIKLGAAGATSSQTSTKSDPWKAWVFRLSMNGNTFGEETYRSFRINGNLSANRITQRWKTQVRGSENYGQNENEIDDSTTSVFITRNYNFSVLQVRSLGAHWSAGLSSEANSSTYENTLRSINVAPALEYNVYPYAQSTRHKLTLQYSLGMTDFRYRDTTIYDKVEETLPLHRLSSSISQKQPWGSIDARLSATQYLHDTGKFRIGIFGYTELKLFKGFNLFLDGGYESIYDQLSLAKKNYTAQEILLRQFQRGTTYSYYAFCGINYTFGSIYNNVVNPRFD